MSKKVITELASYEIKDGILYACLKDDIVISVDVAKRMVKERLAVSDGKVMPMLADIRGLASVDAQSRKYFASNGDSLKYISAGAIVGDSLISRFIGNIFLKIDRPSVKSRFFTNEKNAVKWLKKHTVR